MVMPNPFDTPAFNMTSLTMGINKLPNLYGRVGAMGLMPGQGVTTRSVTIEERNSVLNLLPTRRIGAPGTVGSVGKRKIRSFAIPHIPHDDLLLADEVQGVRAFGQETALETVAELLARKLQTMRNKHAITLEWLRMGALKGLILDADGSTLYDLFDDFSITKKTVDFVLGTATTRIGEKCLEVVRHVEDHLQGEVMLGIRALVSSEFFDKLVFHDDTRNAYQDWQNGLQLRQGFTEQQGVGFESRRTFWFGNIFFEEYRGQATDEGGTVRRFIEANRGHAFPVGTGNTFRTYFAPGDFTDTVNTIGLELYASQEAMDHNRGIDIHTQSNPLPLCRRPEVLVEIFSSN